MGWYMDGKGSYMDGTWMVHGWYVHCKLKVHGWYVDGTWMVHGRYMDGRWMVPCTSAMCYDEQCAVSAMCCECNVL